MCVQPFTVKLGSDWIFGIFVEMRDFLPLLVDSQAALTTSDAADAFSNLQKYQHTI